MKPNRGGEPAQTTSTYRAGTRRSRLMLPGHDFVHYLTTHTVSAP